MIFFYNLNYKPFGQRATVTLAISIFPGDTSQYAFESPETICKTLCENLHLLGKNNHGVHQIVNRVHFAKIFKNP